MEGGGRGGEGGGREGWSDGGEREWCGLMERGSSPGLIVTHVHSLLPMSTHHCPYPCIIACVCESLPVSMHFC